MKVILLDNIKGVGKKDQIINASDGYARNFLFPKKLAVEANNENLAKLKAQNESKAFKKETEKIISSFENETIANVQKGMEKLGQNVSGLPKWSTQNPDKLIERIDKTVTEVLAATSKLLVFPHDKKQNIINGGLSKFRTFIFTSQCK